MLSDTSLLRRRRLLLHILAEETGGCRVLSRIPHQEFFRSAGYTLRTGRMWRTYPHSQSHESTAPHFGRNKLRWRSKRRLQFLNGRPLMYKQLLTECLILVDPPESHPKLRFNTKATIVLNAIALRPHRTCSRKHATCLRLNTVD